MSKRCPYCGSYNTEVSLARYAGRAALQTGRGALILGAMTAAGIFGHGASHAAGHQVMKSTELPNLEGHHCCHCGRYFSAELF